MLLYANELRSICLSVSARRYHPRLFRSWSKTSYSKNLFEICSGRYFDFNSVETEHNGRKIRYKLRRFGLPANQLTFPRGDHNENTDNAVLDDRILVSAYFEEKYKIKLQHPQLPCIDATNGGNKRANWLPMEVAKEGVGDQIEIDRYQLIVGRRMATLLETAGCRTARSCFRQIYYQAIRAIQ